jgi:hypothetical protein
MPSKVFCRANELTSECCFVIKHVFLIKKSTETIFVFNLKDTGWPLVPDPP